MPGARLSQLSVDDGGVVRTASSSRRVLGVADGPRVAISRTGDGLSLGCALGYHYSAKLKDEEGRQPSRAVGSTVITSGRIKTKEREESGSSR